VISFRALLPEDLAALWGLLEEHRNKFETDNTFPAIPEVLTLPDDRSRLKEWLAKNPNSEKDYLLETPSCYALTFLNDKGYPIGCCSFEDVKERLGARLHFILDPKYIFSVLKHGILEQVLLNRFQLIDVPLFRLLVFQHQPQALKLAGKMGFEYMGRCRNVDFRNGEPVGWSLLELTPQDLQAHMEAGGSARTLKRHYQEQSTPDNRPTTLGFEIPEIIPLMEPSEITVIENPIFYENPNDLLSLMPGGMAAV